MRPPLYILRRESTIGYSNIVCYELSVRLNHQLPFLCHFLTGLQFLSVLSAQEESRILLSVNRALVTIIDNDNTTDVNDTTIGDPFFTVPVYVSEQELVALNQESLSLCFEVHGERDKWFNLVTDECVSVNGRFVYLLPSLNVIDEIGVRAVDHSGNCVDISVSVHQCTASVNGVSLALNERYSSGGISVRRLGDRVRISVPNCNDHMLVMWAVCQVDVPGQPPGEMIKLVVTRGLRFNERPAHGLIGK